MLKNGDEAAVNRSRPSILPRFAERSWRSVRHIHKSRSEAGGAFDVSTRGGAKLAERATYLREPEQSWRSARYIHKRRSEAGGAFDISTRGGAKLAERSTCPREAERSWRGVRHIHET